MKLNQQVNGKRAETAAGELVCRAVIPNVGYVRLDNEYKNSINADVEVDEQRPQAHVDLGKERSDHGETKLDRDLKADLDKELRRLVSGPS